MFFNWQILVTSDYFFFSLRVNKMQQVNSNSFFFLLLEQFEKSSPSGKFDFKLLGHVAKYIFNIVFKQTKKYYKIITLLNIAV